MPGQRRVQGQGLFRVRKSKVHAMVRLIKRMHNGFAALFVYLALTGAFFCVLALQKNPTDAFTVEHALANAIDEVDFTPAGDTYREVNSIGAVFDWTRAMIEELYDGTASTPCALCGLSMHAFMCRQCSVKGCWDKNGSPVLPTPEGCDWRCDDNVFPFCSFCASPQCMAEDVRMPFYNRTDLTPEEQKTVQQVIAFTDPNSKFEVPYSADSENSVSGRGWARVPNGTPT